MKKPDDEEKVLKFIIGKMRPEDAETLKKVLKKAAEAVEMIVTEGREKAMGEFN